MVNVIGLGYIGLPTALMMATHGVEVVGTDYNKELVNKMLIQKSLSLLDNYKELSNDWFNRESGEGDIYKILPRGNVEKVSIDELSETECSLLYEALGL